MDPSLDYEDLEEYINESETLPKELRGKLKMDQNYLKLSYTLWFELFSHVLKPIREQIRRLIKNNKETFAGKLKYMVLVGGLSESPYVRWYIRVQFFSLFFDFLFAKNQKK